MHAVQMLVPILKLFEAKLITSRALEFLGFIRDVLYIDKISACHFFLPPLLKSDFSCLFYCTYPYCPFIVSCNFYAFYFYNQCEIKFIEQDCTNKAVIASSALWLLNPFVGLLILHLSFLPILWGPSFLSQRIFTHSSVSVCFFTSGMQAVLDLLTPNLFYCHIEWYLAWYSRPRLTPKFPRVAYICSLATRSLCRGCSSC